MEEELNKVLDTTDAETQTETKVKEEPKTEKKEDKSYYKFNPLQMALKPFYDKAIAEDELFAKEVREKESRKEKPKSLAECAEYIMGEAYKYALEHQNGDFGLAGMPDEDMPNLIKHYYDEDDIVINKIDDNVRAVVKPTTTPVAKTTPATTGKKGKGKPKPVKNVVDLSKIITAKPKSEDGKKVKREKKKDNIFAGFVPMERPDAENYEKEGKKGSREQAKSVEQMDLGLDW